MQGNKKGKQLPYRYKERETEGSLDGGRSAPQVQDKVGKKAGWKTETENSRQNLPTPYKIQCNPTMKVSFDG